MCPSVTSNVPTGRILRGSDYLRPNSLQFGITNLSRIVRMPPILPVEEMLYIVLSEFQSGQRAALMHSSHTAADMVAQEEASTQHK